MGRKNMLKDYLDRYRVSFKTVGQRRSLARSKDYCRQIVALAKECPEEFSGTVRQVYRANQKALSQSLRNKGSEKEPGETHARPSSRYVHQEEPENQDAEPEEQDAEPEEQDAEPEEQDAEPEEQDTEPEEQDTEPEEQDAEPEEQDAEHEEEDAAHKEEDAERKDHPRVKVERTLAQISFLSEHSDEDALSISSAETKDSAQDVISEQESRQEKELRILRGKLPELLRQRCLSEVGNPNRRLKHKEKSLMRLTDKLARFDIEIARLHVVDFLSKRLQQPAQSQSPDPIRPSDPGKLCNSLYLRDARDEGQSLEKAFEQIAIYTSLRIEVKKRESQGTSLAIRKSVRTQILEEWVLQEVKGPVTVEELARRRNGCQRHYNGGLNWLHLIKCFGGQGIIFLFVMAGINPTGFGDYQRQCLKLIAPELHQVKRMVTTLGKDCLTHFYEKGFTPKLIVDRLRALNLFPDDNETENDEDTSTGLVPMRKRIRYTAEAD